MLRASDRSTWPPAADDLVGALGRAGLRFERCGVGLLRLRAPTGRMVYVEEQPHGASGRTTWLVHADAFHADPPRQLPCATVERTLTALRAALDGGPS